MGICNSRDLDYEPQPRPTAVQVNRKYRAPVSLSRINESSLIRKRSKSQASFDSSNLADATDADTTGSTTETSPSVKQRVYNRYIGKDNQSMKKILSKSHIVKGSYMVNDRQRITRSKFAEIPESEMDIGYLKK